jgi:hypothetical protein
MANLKASAIIDLAGNLQQQARRFQQSVQGFATSGSRSMQMLNVSASAAGRTLDQVGNRYVALATGGAVAAASKQTLDLGAAMTQLGVDAEISDAKLAAIKARIFEVANASNIKVDSNELLIGIKEIVARTGDLDLALDNLENIGLTMRATGASGQDSAALVANYFEKFKIGNAKEMLKVLDESARLGHQGAFEMRDLATQGNEVSTAYAATGRTGAQAAREMNVLLQIIRRTAPSASEASTNFERLIATLTAEKVKEFQKNGIKIWDEEALKRGTKMARPIPAIITDILKATKADPEVLAEIFDIRALRAMNAFALEFKGAGGMMGAGAAIPVYIVDGPMSVLDGAGGAAGARGAAGKLRRFEKGAAGVLGAGLVGWEVGTVLNEQFIEGTKFQDALGQALARGMAALGSDAAKEAIFFCSMASSMSELICASRCVWRSLFNSVLY